MNQGFLFVYCVNNVKSIRHYCSAGGRTATQGKGRIGRMGATPQKASRKATLRFDHEQNAFDALQNGRAQLFTARPDHGVFAHTRGGGGGGVVGEM